MKKFIPLFLIIIIFAITVFSYIEKDRNKVEIEDINVSHEVIERDELSEMIYEEGNTENSGGASTVYVENIEFINQFLDLDMMLKYKDLLIVYGLTLPAISSNNINEHYKLNEDLLFEVFGISTFNEYKIINDILKNSSIVRSDILSFVRVESLTQEGNLIKAVISCFYEDKEVELSHYLSYVFIEGMPELYIYNLEGGIHE